MAAKPCSPEGGGSLSEDCDLARRTYVTIFIFVEFTKISFQRSRVCRCI